VNTPTDLKPASHQGHRRGLERDPGGRLRALPEDQELPLAHKRAALLDYHLLLDEQAD
jgi:hypothetical protein